MNGWMRLMEGLLPAAKFRLAVISVGIGVTNAQINKKREKKKRANRDEKTHTTAHTHRQQTQNDI
jgi:hypothetical protein